MSLKLNSEYFEHIADGTSQLDMNSVALVNIGALKHTGTTAGFFSTTAAARPAAYTQTYATATRTHSNPTAAAVATTSATNTGPYGYAQAQADAIVTALNALVIDMVNVKSVLNSVVDDMQTLGLLQ